MNTPFRLFLCLSVSLAAFHFADGADAPHQLEMTDSVLYPWFNGNTLPTAAEKKILQAARDAAEKDPKVVDLAMWYTVYWVEADDAIRIKMLENPASKPFIRYIVMCQMIHETSWTTHDDNYRDILLPNGSWDPITDAAGLMVDAFGKDYPHESPSPDSMEGIRLAALADKDVQATVEKVRHTYDLIDQAVRTVMAQNPDVKALLDKYRFLLYGRKDLGYIPCSYGGDELIPAH